MSEKERLGYELNSHMPWMLLTSTSARPEPYRAFLALVEEDTCDPTAYPAVYKLAFEPHRVAGQRYRLLELTHDDQEEYLPTNWQTIVAWRYLTDHGGTWDEWFKNNPDEDVTLVIDHPET